MSISLDTTTATVPTTTTTTGTLDHNYDEVIHLLTTVLATLASLVLLCLIALQSDAVSRRVFPPARLRSRRRNEQRYRLEQAIAGQILRVRRYVNGGEEFESETERCITEVIWDDGDVDELVADVVRNGGCDGGAGCLCPVIVGLSLDLSPKGVVQAQDWYLYLAFPELDSMGRCSYGRRVQTPLIKFGTRLAAAFWSSKSNRSPDADTDTDTDICFVSDASSGIGTQILTEFFQRYSHPHESNSPTNLVIQEPAWMTTFAYLVQIKTFETHDTAAEILYGLCRLQLSTSIEQASWQTLPSSTTTKTITAPPKNYGTTILTLPGQSSTATLLPLLRQVFPNDKFLFCHDTCLNAVSRGIELHTTATATDAATSIGSSTSMPRTISATVPIALLRTVADYETLLATLPAHHAAVLEAWMTSVDSFLGRTGVHTNGYSISVGTLVRNLPTATPTDGAADPPLSDDDADLVRMIQYVTSPPVAQPTAARNAARELLADVTGDVGRSGALALGELRAIEKIALAHDGIRTDGRKRFV